MRWDYILWKRWKKNVIFIELKGTDFEAAVEQIKESILRFLKKFPKDQFNYKVGAVIIHSGSVPNHTKGKKLKNKLVPLLDKTLRPPKTSSSKGVEDITNYIKS